jgi:hypothetical protein
MKVSLTNRDQISSLLFCFKRFFIKYAFAIGWVVILLCFSYAELITDFVRKDGIGFEKKLIEIHSSFAMIVVSMGIVFMLYIDNYIICLINKKTRLNRHIEFLLFANMMIAVILTYFAYATTTKEILLNDTFKLSYLFITFIVILIIYKAESLPLEKVYSDSEGNGILPSKQPII